MLYREEKGIAQMSLPPWGRGAYEDWCPEKPISYAKKIVWKFKDAWPEAKKDGRVIPPPGIESKGVVSASCGGFYLRFDWQRWEPGTQHKIHAHSYEQLYYILEADPRTCFQLLVDDEVYPLSPGCAFLNPWRSKHGFINIGESGKDKPIIHVTASGPRLRPAEDVTESALEYREFEEINGQLREKQPADNVLMPGERGAYADYVDSEPVRYWKRLFFKPDDFQPVLRKDGTPATEVKNKYTKEIINPKTAGSLTTRMAICELPPGAQTELHWQNYEELNFIISGKGWVEAEGTKYDIEANDGVFMPIRHKHRHKNTGDEPLKFLIWTSLVSGARPYFGWTEIDGWDFEPLSVSIRSLVRERFKRDLKAWPVDTL